MLPLRPQLLGLVLACAPLALGAAEWRLPPISGELEGDFTPLKVPDAPKLHWQITAQRAGPAERDLRIAVDGAGLRMRLSAHVDAAVNGTWKIETAVIETGAWLPVIVALAANWPGNFTLTGTAEISGEGTLRDGQFGGRAQLRLSEARLDVPAQKLTLEGLTLELVLEDVAAIRSAPSQKFSWQRGKYGEVVLGAGEFFYAASTRQVEVSYATINVLGGEIILADFTTSLEHPKGRTNATVRGIDLAQLKPFLPKIISDTQGRLDGYIQLGWGPKGLEIGDGRLGLREGEKAELRFMPQPGILAGSLPAQVTKYYTGLADLEQGKVPLRAEVLDVVLTPAGDAEGRTAKIHVAGGPVDPRLKAPLDLTFNVRAPLDWFVNFGAKIR